MRSTEGVPAPRLGLPHTLPVWSTVGVTLSLLAGLEDPQAGCRRCAPGLSAEYTPGLCFSLGRGRWGTAAGGCREWPVSIAGSRDLVILCVWLLAQGAPLLGAGAGGGAPGWTEPRCGGRCCWPGHPGHPRVGSCPLCLPPLLSHAALLSHPPETEAARPCVLQFSLSPGAHHPLSTRRCSSQPCPPSFRSQHECV